jgi:hypothetical protein
MSRSVIFSSYSHTPKCTTTQFGTQHTQHLLTQWFKPEQCLACHMLFLWERTHWSVQLKKDISMNLQFLEVTKKSVQRNGGHLFLVPYCSNQGNKFLYSFLSSRTDCIWTAQHPDWPALPQNSNIIILWDWSLNNIWGYTWHVQRAPNFIARSPLTTGTIWKE